MIKEKILIFGTGQIGSFYLDYFKKKNLAVKAIEPDIRDIKKAERAINSFKPSVVINVAALTNLEECSQKKAEAFEVNVLGADNLAQICDQQSIYFIHFSSGCIFQSKNQNDAKKEDDLPNPAAYYAWTKVWSEQLIQFNKSPDFKYLILRPRQPISSKLDYKNTLVKFLTFTKFIDVPNTVTILEDLMDWTFQLIKKKPIGVFHVANSGFTTPFRAALLLKKHILPSLDVNKIFKQELNKLTPNKRVDTILNIDKLKKIGIKPRRLEERLEQIIIGLKKNIERASQSEVRKQLEKAVAQSKTRTIVNEAWRDLIK
ncbi:sugar nucleotide-binding protein [Patescibacteria group bacterium]|nr:sugar nucleotide-binding protein [Patescibacteria group bacterium]MBU1563922.1 sugar nucleotide-binding protein [Patescibacteria group bacterium]MBU2068602.1 sugar nucleotide-binding protein [Patescibacteria group bacterium]